MPNLTTPIQANATTLIALDDDGHLCDYQQWTPQIAQTLADSLNITLEPIHYRILYAVREFFRLYHHSPSTRPLIKHLATSLPDDKLSNQHLQALFGTGLVARHINRIAGLPKPANCL